MLYMSIYRANNKLISMFQALASQANMVCSYTVFLPLLLFMFIVIVPCSRSEVQSLDNFKPSVLAILVFGDSTVDPGNNNYIGTALFRSDFPPYGEDFLNHIPTGRFTNGKLTTDYIASHLGIKEYVPPYLDITLGVEELMTSVSFASAGSGYDPLTGQIDVFLLISSLTFSNIMHVFVDSS
ncbi:hypothetical protein IFM89_027786 [Coptis chinensis]|uniref:GDSL esterase/lipase n=1 Tax=Coptis chinensis TaxID=261450 RepID=A0A835J2J1_9MAGN|nr:hypothetical protein IFM89_027786 [Coptis chinensis]